MLNRVRWQTEPHRWGVLVTVLAFGLLLGLWWLANGWYQAGLVAEEQGREEIARRDQKIFQWTGLLIVGLTTGLVYLTASRQTYLSQTVQSQIKELEQARHLLEQRVTARTHELETLLTISHDLTALLELKPLLALIMERAKEVVAYDQAALFQINEDNQLELLLSVGPGAIISSPLPLLLTDLPIYQQAIQEGRPLVIADVKVDTELARLWHETIGRPTAGSAQTWLTVPLLFQGRSIGILSLGHNQAHTYTPHRANLAMAFANQAAVALENAQLFQQAQDLASLEERRHLARELHDSVSQALYGIALGTRTARMLLDRDPTKLAQPLDYINPSCYRPDLTGFGEEFSRKIKTIWAI